MEEKEYLLEYKKEKKEEENNEGKIIKWGVFKWNERYYSLNIATLSYSLEKGKEARGTYFLGICTLKKVKNNLDYLLEANMFTLKGKMK